MKRFLSISLFILALVVGFMSCGRKKTQGNLTLPPLTLTPPANVFFTPTPFANTEVRKPGRGAYDWNNTEQFSYPTPDWDYYRRFSWGDLQNLNTGAINLNYLDQEVQNAFNGDKRFNFGIMGFYPGAPTSTYGAGPESITVGGFGLSYPLSVHTAMQAGTYKDVGVTSCNNPPIFAASWCPNYNDPSIRNAYNHLIDTVIYHLKHTNYTGPRGTFTGWQAVGYVEIREYGSTGEWTSFNINTATSGSNPGGCSPFPLPANIVAADTTVLDFCTDMIARVNDKRLMLTTNGLTGENLFDFSVHNSVAVQIMAMHNNVGPFGIRRDCFGQTDTYVSQFYENNTTVYGGVNFAHFFDSAYYFRPWVQEPCSCCTSLPAGSGNAPAYPDVPRQAVFYHISSLANGNYVLIGTTAQQNSSIDSIQLASKLSGYRMIIDSGYVTPTVVQNTTFNVELTYQNTGVTAPYDHWIPTFQLRTGSTVLATYTSKADHYMFQPGTTSTVIDTFTMTGIAPGIDSLYLVTQDTSGYWPPFFYDIISPTRNTDGSYLLHKVVVTANSSPTANAGPNQNLFLPSSTTTLDGTGSGGTIASYLWTQISGPNTANIVTPTTATTAVTGLIVGTYVFQLSLNGGVSTSQVYITVNPTPTEVTIFTNQVPPVTVSNDGVPLELGVKFRASNAGYVKALRFYKNIGNVGTHTGELYSYPAGTRLGQVVFTGETTSGWQQMSFSTPIGIAANTTYVAAYFSSSGNYTVSPNYFGTSVSNPPLTGLADGSSGPNGVYQHNATPIFPSTSAGNAPNYWVDIVFANDAPPIAIINPPSPISVVYPSTSTLLDGTASNDPDGSIFSYSWTQVSGPSSALIGTPTLSTTNVSNLIDGTYTFMLSVTDNLGVIGTTTTQVVVTGRAPSHFIIGTGTGFVTVNGMGSYIPGDTLEVATQTGTYTSLNLQNINHLWITSQSGVPIFTQTGTWCTINNIRVSNLSFNSDGTQTYAINATCGVWDSVTVDHIGEQGWSSEFINAAGGTAYTYGNNATYKWFVVTLDSITQFHGNKVVQGSFGVTGSAFADVMRQVTLSRITDYGTTATSFEGNGFTGICFHCTAHDIQVSSTTQRGASGDIAWIAGTGWWHVWNLAKWGGPGYDVRVFPMQEYQDTGSNWLTTSAKFNGTEYGLVNYQFNAGDTIAGQYMGTNCYIYNNTLGNQFNDTLGYWSPLANLGQTPPNMHYYVKNNFGFNIGQNQQITGVGPNGGKQFIAVNLGGWSGISTDTSNNTYIVSATLAKLDSTTVGFTNSQGNFFYYKFTGVSPPQVFHSGLTNPFVSVDYFGTPFRVPPDLGYYQFTGTVPPPGAPNYIPRKTHQPNYYTP